MGEHGPHPAEETFAAVHPGGPSRAVVPGLKAELPGHAVVPQAPVRRRGHHAMHRVLGQGGQHGGCVPGEDAAGGHAVALLRFMAEWCLRRVAW